MSSDALVETLNPSEPAEFDSSRIPSAEQGPLPRVFLMVNTLETGGSERQFVSLAHTLDRQRFSLSLGCIRRTGPFAASVGNIPEFRLGGSLYGRRSIAARLRLAWHLSQGKATIAHAFDFYTNLVLAPAARIAGVPIVIGSHRQLGDLLTRTQVMAQTAALRCCDRVICNSRAAAQALADCGIPRRRIVVIGNGLPAQAFAAAIPALPRRPGWLRVGMIARMNAAYKGHQLFLRAAARLSHAFPHLEFVLAGDGPLRGELQNLAEHLGIADRTIFLGDRRDIPEVLAALDATVLCSTSESLSNVILESMAAGVAVVATRVGGNPELLENGRGMLVPTGDEEALANGVLTIFRDHALRKSVAERARQFAAANYTQQVMTARHEQLYQELLEEKGIKRGMSTLPESVPVKVAVVAPSLRYVGGQSVQADLMLRHWTDDKDVRISFIPVDPPLPEGLAWVESVPGLRTICREPIYLWKLFRHLGGKDIAHIFSASYWSFRLAPAPAWLFAKLRGTKTLINYRSGEARDHLQRYPEAARVLKATHRVIVPSGYLASVFQEFGIAAEVIPNIADLSQFSFRQRVPLRPHMVCTRGFHPYYGIDVVVHAFAEIRTQLPGATLALVGKGQTENEIRKLVNDLALEGVEFAGVASRQHIGDYYDRADIFINGSCLDNMPVSIVEAFAAGTPVVTTAPEGMEYLVEHERTGLLSPPGDAHALAQNVMRLFREDGLAERLAHNARQESRKFTWEAVRGQWLRVYRELMEGLPN